MGERGSRDSKRQEKAETLFFFCDPKSAHSLFFFFLLFRVRDSPMAVPVLGKLCVCACVGMGWDGKMGQRARLPF